MDGLIPRAAAEQLRDAAAEFRVVIVNGPRQAGKTTLLDMFHTEHGGTYRSFDNAEDLRGAQADPVSYVRLGERPLIIDEVQRGGHDVVLAIKHVADQDRRSNQFILSGSTRFLTIPTLSESLAGRAVFVDLWPFCMAERVRSKHSFVDTALYSPESFVGSSSTWSRQDYLNLIFQGSYPEALRTSVTSRRRWFNGYIRTVLARDISEFADVQHPPALRRLLTLIAARSGSTFVLADLAGSLAVTHDTIKTYTSYLEMVFLVALVPTWSTNFTSRLTKAPKAYVTDTGLAANLVQPKPDALQLPGHPLLGGLVETFVFTELMKLRSLSSDAFEIYHYRDRDGREIDLLCETPDGRILAIEVKASASPSPRDAQHLRWLRDKLGERFIAGIILHMGERCLSYGDRILAAPLSTLWGHAHLYKHDATPGL